MGKKVEIHLGNMSLLGRGAVPLEEEIYGGSRNLSP